ncbi:MAG: large conductance mechanosensitive channel protein MscL [Actinobacteria bacterium]|jgi:large conductance mechanosensitive channel|nr:large conductance mechanosensitive channel protein MscL [Actinomycetota bacterium]
MLKDFKAFIDQGNLLQLAIAFIMGVTFAAVVTSLVNDIIMPAVGLGLGGVDFTNLYAVIKNAPTGPADYANLEAAQAAGAVTINYGVFINAIIVFIIVALVLFFLMKAYMKTQKPAEATTRDCPFCKSTVPIEATRCPQCTSELPVATQT